MKLVKQKWWLRLAWASAFSTLLLYSQPGVAQDETADSNQSINLRTQRGSVSDAFDQYVNMDHVIAAWHNLDSVAMTDAALQFIEAERVLLRSHHAINASQVFDLAIRVATENGDKASLERLEKTAERLEDKERGAQISLAKQAAGAARSVDPVLSEGEVSTIQSIQAEIQSARVAGSTVHLNAIESSLADIDITDEQRAALSKEIAEAKEAEGDNKDSLEAAVALDRLSGVIRPIDEVLEPEGQQFNAAGYTGDFPVDEQLKAYALAVESWRNPDHAPFGANEPTGELAQLSRPSRGAGWTDQAPFDPRPRGKSRDYAYNAYGVKSIYQYTNNPTKWEPYNCGQAAVATMLTFHGKYHKDKPRKNGTTKLQDILETSPFNPDIWKINVFGSELGGGTSPLRVMSCANNYGLNTWVMNGHETKLREYVSAGWPCIVVSDVGRAGWKQANGTKMKGLHYTVVYAWSNTHYWCTNWQGGAKVARQNFLNGWVSLPNCDFILTQPKP